MIKFSKVSKAEAYHWCGIGKDNGSVAATYACKVNGEVKATIKREYGGGFMAATTWVARLVDEGVDMYGRTVPAGTLVVATASTLREVKERLRTKYS